MTAINVLQSKETDKFYYRRHLPHYQPTDAIFFVTFRLAGSLPSEVVEQMRLDREKSKKRINEIRNHKARADEWEECNDQYFARFDDLLDKNKKGSLWLLNPRIADLVKDAIHYRDNKEYELIVYSIMPNHVHLVFDVGRLEEAAVNGVGRLEEAAVNGVGRLACPPFSGGLSRPEPPMVGTASRPTSLRKSWSLSRSIPRFGLTAY
jgi:hypothetical protein